MQSQAACFADCFKFEIANCLWSFMEFKRNIERVREREREKESKREKENERGSIQFISLAI
jgi:hypothetical protein